MTTTTNLTIAGIDYSMTLPCICLHDRHGYDFHYLTTQKKYHLSLETDDFTVTGHVMPLYDDDLDRWDKISKWAMDVMQDWSIDLCVLEDYSFASTGRTFQIGEHFGLLKYKMKRSIIPFVTVPPTVLKKFATGKGNAKKEQMYEAFVEQTGFDIRKELGITRKLASPETDCIDAYFIAQYIKTLNHIA